jgi:hypothetical protein
MMKFETPLVKFMVTADGPACFDINKEGGNVAIEHMPVDKGICQCLCKCTTEVCKCMCECICECLCRCKCECICECLCLDLPFGSDNKIQGASVSNANHKAPVSAPTIAFGRQFMLRRESFGGLLFNKESFSSYLCNHSAFEILRFIENQRDGFSMAKISELVHHLHTVFDEVPNNVEIIVLAFMRGCTKQTFVEGI